MTDWIEPERSARRLLRRGAGAERVSDADRDHAVTLLREHVVVGRLTLDEFSERVGVALRARTRDDIAGAMSDLPVLAVAAEEGTRRRARRWVVAVMSRSQAKGRWRLSGRTTAVAVMGGCDMDLRHAEIDGAEVVITALAFWGGIQIVVPEGFDVELVGLSLHGEPGPENPQRDAGARIAPYPRAGFCSHGRDRREEQAAPEPVGRSGSRSSTASSER